MHKGHKICLAWATMLSSAHIVWAQRQQSGADAAAGAAGCALCGTLIFIPITIFALNIACWYGWRGMPSLGEWTVPYSG